MTKEKHAILAPIGLGLIVFAGAFLLSNDTHAASYNLTLSSSSSQSIDVSNMGDKTAISADNINVATNCRYGYNLTLSTSVNNNNLYLNGNSSNNTTGTYFSPVNGTTSLKNSPNTWGYYYNSSTPTTAPTSSNVFSPVPTLSNPATIKTPLTTPSSSDINDNFNVYYGVASSDDMPVGTYKLIPDTNNSNNDGTLVYNATIADTCIAYTVHFNPTSYFEGKAITGAGTMNDQTIYEGMTISLANVTFSNPTRIDGVDYYFAGWNTAQDGSGTQYINTEDVTDLATAGSNITLYAIWTDCPAKKVCYSSNATSGLNGTMGDGNIKYNSYYMDLMASNYSRLGYGFAGWNTKKDGTGVMYGPNEKLYYTTYKQYDTGGLKLYAIWIPATGNIQNWNGCPDMNIGDVTALTDSRDNNTYAIAKLADGRCWMIENLRLDHTANTNTSGALAQGYSSSFAGLAESESANFSETNIANSLYRLDTDTTSTATIIIDSASHIVGTTDFSKYDFPRYNNDNTQNRASSPTSNGSRNIYSRGNYYTWTAAIADTDHYEGGIHNTTSICPKGWHLPVGGNTTMNEFGMLSNALGGKHDNNGIAQSMTDYTTPAGATMSEVFRKYPNNFIYSGYFLDSSSSNIGVYGNYWSSTSSGGYRGYDFHINNTVVYPANNDDYKYYGNTIRCISDS